MGSVTIPSEKRPSPRFASVVGHSPATAPLPTAAPPPPAPPSPSSLAITPTGPNGWQPILYACFSRLLRGDPERAPGIREAVARLLAAGADPNAASTASCNSRAVGAEPMRSSFRAEKSRTPKHLTEFWMIEPEVAYCDLDGLLELAENLNNYLNI